MKRRSFIGSLLAIIPAVLIFPRIPKPAPEGIPLYSPPNNLLIAARGGENLEIGDAVFINENGKIEKYTLKQGNMIGGYVISKEFNSREMITNHSEIVIGGFK